MSRIVDLAHRHMPSLPPKDWERPVPSRVGLRRDIVAALGFLVLALALQELVLSMVERDEMADRPVAFALIVALIVPLMFRRRWPVSMMLIGSAVFMLGGSQPTASVLMQFCPQVAYFLGLYTAVAWARDRRALWTAMTLVLLAMAVWLIVSFFTSDLLESMDVPMVENSLGSVEPRVAFPLYTFAINILYFGGAIFLGLTSWSNAYAGELVRSQARRIADQVDQLASQAVSEERLRIARELHDVIAHHIASVGVQASAARMVQGRDPDKASELMRGIESSARSAVSETRALLGVLRSTQHGQDANPTDGDRHPEPSLQQLDRLIEQNADLGLRVELSTAEHRAQYFSGLPSGLSLALYRICSEALANVRRHSTARSARLSLRSGTDEGGTWVEVEVTDEGTARPDSAGGGYGLRGIRERAALHHGLVEIGPRTPRGWRTRARLRDVSDSTPDKVQT
ncbi:sensor histidine kinase [Glutamicibacter endophyticus]|uniref:sensor histidine kinase n=1 Tax=Glutamicibacter endophyticus TaxID=1522174 RepID=UPI003AF14B2A